MTEKSSAASDGAPSGSRAQDLAINGTLVNRLYTRLALKTWGRLYKSAGICYPISRKMIIKTGRWVDLTEAATMKFISQHTSIPVPKVHCSFVHKGRTYILMERIQGENVHRAWTRHGEEGRAKIFAQLRQMIDEMRALKPPPGTGVQSCVGGSLHDSRCHRQEPRFGPFATIQEFHFWLRKEFRLADHPHPERLNDEERQELVHMETLQDGPWPSPVFTHADLNPSNILVRGDKIVAIIDWEFAGWYPHYWEFTSNWFGSQIMTDWQDSLVQFLEHPSPANFAMEITRNKWWGFY